MDTIRAEQAANEPARAQCAIEILKEQIDARSEKMADFQIENGVLVKYTGASGDTTVPEGVTSIGDFAFSECENVVSVVLPEDLTSIGSYAFLDCDNLKRITIPQSVTVIGSGAFKSCTSLETVTLPKHIAAIGDGFSPA